MTPEREKYLAKCSKREIFLRKKIADLKMLIKGLKYAIYKDLGPPYHIDSREWLRLNKYEISAYRHELARLKGMDRVIRVKDTYMDSYGEICFRCKCGNEMDDGYYDYCFRCGRRLL